MSQVVARKVEGLQRLGVPVWYARYRLAAEPSPAFPVRQPKVLAADKSVQSAPARLEIAQATIGRLSNDLRLPDLDSSQPKSAAVQPSLQRAKSSVQSVPSEAASAVNSQRLSDALSVKLLMLDGLTVLSEQGASVDSVQQRLLANICRAAGLSVAESWRCFEFTWPVFKGSSMVAQQQLLRAELVSAWLQSILTVPVKRVWLFAVSDEMSGHLRALSNLEGVECVVLPNTLEQLVRLPHYKAQTWQALKPHVLS